MIFKKGQLNIRHLVKNDHILMAKWLSNPTVLTFYEGRDSPFNLQKVYREFFEDDSDITRCMIEYDGVRIGYIQFYQVDRETLQSYGYHSESKIYGMDQFIGEADYWDKGIGTMLVTSMVEYLVDVQKAERILMDPQTWNTRAIRCYEKSGFQKVKKLPKHEYHEGEFRDCWLMEYEK